MTQVLFEAAIGVVVMAAAAFLLFVFAGPMPGWLTHVIEGLISASNF